MNKKYVLLSSFCISSLLSLPACNGKCENQEQQTAKNLAPESTPQKKEPSMTTLNSGLKYETLTPAPADAAKPTKGKPVTVHYTGWLADKDGKPQMDKKFDSSLDRGQPFTFILGIGQVIQGWDQGVADMKVGEKRRLYIPADLAYGNRAVGNIIPANSMLVFDVELLKA